jgi:sulfatase modifying factor 1
VEGREWTGMVIPYGMVPIPAGTFHMGQADQDVAATQINFNKQVTIGAFFMDDSEITNNEYRQFVDAIMMDSLSILGEDYVMNELYPDSQQFG